MHGRTDARRLGRTARHYALLSPLILMGCVQQPVEQPRSPSSACEQEARRLGFTVLDVGAATPQPDGAVAVPILVQWGIDGAATIRCRYDSTYGATLG